MPGIVLSIQCYLVFGAMGIFGDSADAAIHSSIIKISAESKFKYCKF